MAYNKYILECLEYLKYTKDKTLNLVVNKDVTVRVTKITFKGRVQKNRFEYRITVGKPNYKVREKLKKISPSRWAGTYVFERMVK